MNRRFSILTTLIVVLICGIPVIAQAQLFDGEREGLLGGVGVGYAAVQSSAVDMVSGFTGLGKIGYGLSNQFSLHLITLPPDITPGIGFNYFSNPISPLYLHGALGYASANQDSNILIAGGLGYEFRKYMSLEATLGLNRYSDTYTSSIDIYTGQVYNDTAVYNILTFVVAFNFTYY